ncbi:hypothetical protein H5410_027349 [Solanum commersonii]|uniref:Uncharacterized protein n=1 Tax=Solanum commersonii TaxID=4109 RepID=A0A9J5YYZ2_SOLCO|nr:hypothetical protein H5410_027349 [Solanum commersonii]
MTQHIHSLQERIRFLLENTNQTIPLKSFLSHYKMDKTGVHSPTIVERAIVPAKGTTSPVQTVAGKDSSYPKFRYNSRDKQKDKGIPPKKKKNKRIEKLIKSSLYKLLTEKTKEVIQEKIIRENPEPDPADSDREDIESRSDRSDENDLSIDQFNQHYDPNEDNDLGMSFDSIALHNLDT